jgi:uncharacterized membrane protein YesL
MESLKSLIVFVVPLLIVLFVTLKAPEEFLLPFLTGTLFGAYWMKFALINNEETPE